MTFVSCAQACRRLGSDAKTLHRWLAEEELAVHRHPSDARKKGVSSEHLHLLACRHQRSLRPLPHDLPALLPQGEPQLTATLLALPERLDALQGQLSGLQQQVAALSNLLPPHVPEPASLSPPAKPPRTASRAPLPVPAAHRKPAPVIPRVEYAGEGRYVVIDPKRGLLPVEPDSPEWFAWVTEQSSFRFVGKAGHFSAHHEARVPAGAWRAHRHLRNHVRIQRLAKSQELTIAVLEQAAAMLQAYLK